MADKKVVGWFTMNGKHIPMFEGETKKDAVKRSVEKGKKHQPVSKGYVDKKEKEFFDASKKAEIMDSDIEAPKFRKEELKKAIELDKAVEQREKAGEIKKVKISDKTKKQLDAEKTINKMDKDLKKHPEWEDKDLTKHENKRAKKENAVASKNEDIKTKQIADTKKQSNMLNKYKDQSDINTAVFNHMGDTMFKLYKKYGDSDEFEKNARRAYEVFFGNAEKSMYSNKSSSDIYNALGDIAFQMHKAGVPSAKVKQAYANFLKRFYDEAERDDD